MLKTAIFLFLITITSLIHAQDLIKKVDSLEHIIAHTTSDSIKVNEQIQLAETLGQSHPSNAKFILEDALSVLQHLNYTYSNKYQKQAYIYDLLGINSRRQSNYNKALDYYFKALELKEQHNDTTTIGRSFHNLALLFCFIEEYKKAETYIQQALKYRKKYNDSIQYAKSLNSYGLIKYRLNQPDSAVYYYSLAKQHFGTNYRIAYVNSNLCKLYIKNGQYEKAKRIYQENIDVYKNNNLLEQTVTTYRALSRVNRKLNHLNQAKINLDKAEAIALKINSKKSLSMIFFERYKIASIEQNYKNALQYFKTYKKLKDSVFSIRNTQKIKEIELNYLFEKEKLTDSLNFSAREQQLVIFANSHKKQNRLYSVLLSVTAIGFICILLLYQYKKKLNNELKQKQVLEFELLNSKLENMSNYVEHLVVDNNMRFQFKEELLSKIKNIKNQSQSGDFKTYQTLIVDLQTQINTEKRLDSFNKTSDYTNTKLEKQLIDQFPKLTKSEREICGLIKLNLSHKEIMNIRNVSLDSVKSARYRIRKKMNVPKGVKLEAFIQNLLTS